MMPTRTSLKKNLMAACSIGVMAVAITGCSSSDKDSVSPALQRQVSAAQGAQAAALAAQAAAETERDAAQAALTGAEGERDAAQAALTGAEEALEVAIADLEAAMTQAGLDATAAAIALTDAVDAAVAAAEADAAIALTDAVAAAVAAAEADAAIALTDAVAAAVAAAEADAAIALTDAVDAAVVAAEADAAIALTDAVAAAVVAAEAAAAIALTDAVAAAVAPVQAALTAALEAAGVTPGADMVASIEALAEALVEAKADLALVEEEVAAAKAKVAEEERVARAGGFDTALRTGSPEDGTVPDAFEVKRSDDGRTVTVEVVDSDYDAVTGTPDEHGWTTVTLVDEGKDSTETLVVYTNIDTPTDESLIKEEGGENGQFAVWDQSETVNKLEKARPLPSIVSNLRSAAALLKDDTTTLQVGADDEFTVGGVTTMTRTFDGSYNGVSGTFVCASEDGCGQITVTYTVATNDEEEMVSLAADVDADDWYFQPADTDATVKVADMSYVAFGTLTTMPEDAKAAHGFVTFFDASTDPFDGGGIDALIGTGTYDGPAIGRYATTNAIEDSKTSGEFLAEAHLRANFDTDDLALKESSLPDDAMLGPNMIWGEIRNFEEDGESLGAWRVDLEAASLGADNTFNGMTKLEVGKLLVDESDTGTWNGKFYGNGGTPADLVTEEDGNDEMPASTAAEIAAAQPSGVAGEFNAQFGSEDNAVASVIIVGAFGASRTGK